MLSPHFGEELGLAKTVHHEVLRARVAWRHEHMARGIELDQLTEIHEAGEVGDPRGLLEIGGTKTIVRSVFDSDRLLDLGRGNRIDRGARLIEQ